MIIVAIIVLILVVQLGRILFKLMTEPRPTSRPKLTLYEQPGRRWRRPVTSEQPRQRRSRSSYQEQLAQAADRYEAEQREEEARFQSLPREPVPIVALHETENGHIGVGADGELVEIDPSQIGDDLTDAAPSR